MSPFRDHFQTYQAIEPRTILAANKHVFYTIGTGDLWIEVPHGESSTPIILKDILHAPEMGLTIVSVNWICKAGNSVMFKDDICTIKNKDNKVIGIIPASANRLYKVEHTHAAMVALEHVELTTLHHHLCHITPNSLHVLISKGAVDGVQLIDN